jgi:hypothetical protein
MSIRFHRGLGYTSFVIDAGLPEECSLAAEADSGRLASARRVKGP